MSKENYKDNTYTIKVTYQQAKLISQALDFNARLFMGQYGELRYALAKLLFDKLPDSVKFIYEWIIKSLERTHSEAYFSNSNEFSELYEEANKFYQMFKCIDNRLANDEFPDLPEKERRMNVRFDTPRKISDLPLLDIKKD